MWRSFGITGGPASTGTVSSPQDRANRAYSAYRAFDARPVRAVRPVRPVISFHRNLVLVPLEPLVERLQLRVQLPSRFDVTHADELIVEVPLELEHVAQVISTGEAEAAIDVGGNGVVLDFLVE